MTAAPGEEEAVTRLLASELPDIRFISVGDTLKQVTDALGTPRNPGAWYEITVTASGNGKTQTTTLRLLVDGSTVYAPVVRR